jgi:DNA 3'-phosphatase
MQTTITSLYITATKPFPSPITKIILFDLDSTLIRTKSGRKFAKDKDDWVPFNENVIPMLTNQPNTLLGIITNQSGLKTPEKQNDWLQKINNITSIMPIHFVFASITHSIYRKPQTGSYQHLLTLLNTQQPITDQARFASLTDITYIGDACGRKDDFADTDLKYAMNCKMKFATPETFFQQTGYKPHTLSITTPYLDYYTDEEMETLLNKLTTPNTYIVCIGLPASGKTTLRKMIVERCKANNVSVDFYNNDDKHKKLKQPTATVIVNDNTNMVFENIEKMTERKTIYVKFDHEPEVIEHLNAMRQWISNKICGEGGSGGLHIPDMVYAMMRKKQTNIQLGNVDELFVVNKLFPCMRCDDLLYYA